MSSSTQGKDSGMNDKELTAAGSGGTTKQRLTPSTLVQYLDQYVVGQEDAKKVLAVAIYSHYKKLASARTTAIEFSKSNVLLIGPTGSGKTLVCETLARALNVPFVTADATSLAQTKYVNEEVESILLRLLDKAEGNLQKAQNGIVFIDEIDKLKASPGSDQSTSGDRVQHALLKIMEGARVKLGEGRFLDTANILFICGGAFVGLEKITSKSNAFGFLSMTDEEDRQILERLSSRIKPTDLFLFGLIPEFVGRLPVVARFHALSKEALVKVMTEPKNSLYRQYQEMLRQEGVTLKIEHQVFEQIAELAEEYKVGARGLRGLFEEVLAPLLYVIPDRNDVRQVLINSLFEEPRLLTEEVAAG
jgi:ATP-dependent Clp protease ATP-binding subunit ClpX